MKKLLMSVKIITSRFSIFFFWFYHRKVLFAANFLELILLIPSITTVEQRTLFNEIISIKIRRMNFLDNHFIPKSSLLPQQSAENVR